MNVSLQMSSSKAETKRVQPSTTARIHSKNSENKVGVEPKKTEVKKTANVVAEKKNFEQKDQKDQKLSEVSNNDHLSSNGTRTKKTFTR